MNASVAVFLTILVVVSAGYYKKNNWDHLQTGYEGKDGFERSIHGIHAPYNNAARQKFVNHYADKFGFSSGTAKYYGVLGTGNYFDDDEGLDHYGRR